MFKGFKFPNSFQKKSISQGESGIVYEFRVPMGAVAFIERVGLHIPSSNCSFMWKIDGELVEEGGVIHQLGAINDPIGYNPKIVSRKKIEFIGKNDGDTDETFEVFCDGVYVIDD